MAAKGVWSGGDFLLASYEYVYIYVCSAYIYAYVRSACFLLIFYLVCVFSFFAVRGEKEKNEKKVLHLP